VGRWSPIGSTRHCGHLMTYCASPGWLWWWRNWWNDWQGKPKYSEKTCPSAASSTTNPTCCPDANPGRRGGKPASNRWATARPLPKLTVRRSTTWICAVIRPANQIRVVLLCLHPHDIVWLPYCYCWVPLILNFVKTDQLVQQGKSGDTQTMKALHCELGRLFPPTFRRWMYVQ
jgi:hypothetical protein